ncbi:MAG: hypothetical protein LBM08_07040 [Dysgonamonadaceae bacterium]|jgi:hypothetical protein|nr:hypothetical protein [Dysgonamonadaceae bacterium]
MEANSRKLHYKRKIFVFTLVFLLLLSRNLLAQQVRGPFTYSPSPALVQSIWSLNSDTANYTQIKMSDIPPFSGDGLMVGFDFIMESGIINKGRSLVRFFDKSITSYPIINIIYSNNSLIIRRRYRANNDYYDYKLYDRMFENYQQTCTINIYMTANFIFITTKEIGSSYFYLSPVLFGINLPKHDIMGKYLSRSSEAVILIGNADNLKKPLNMKLYSFDASALRDDILNNFVSH